MDETQRTEYIVLAGALEDALGLALAPGALLVRDGRIAIVGSPGTISRAAEAGHRVLDYSGMVVLPRMVNAHAHLDLTGVGPVPPAADFLSWLGLVMQQRPTGRAAIGGAVRQGAASLREAGVGYVIDIAGSDAAAMALHQVVAQSPGDTLLAISCLEALGIGHRAASGAERLEMGLATLRQAGLEPAALQPPATYALGVSPHAVYSAGPELFDRAAAVQRASGCVLTTHLAESPEELAFTQSGSGPFRALLERLGAWQEGIAHAAAGRHPVDMLAGWLGHARCLLVHCNYLDAAQVALLGAMRASVAYCPVASDYFGFAAKEGHPYRRLTEAGVNVCLGTDSILCQPPDEPQPLGILAQMRHLYRRDDTDPRMLLRMATVNGLRAMGLPPAWGRLAPGAPARLMAVPLAGKHEMHDALRHMLASDEPAQCVPLLQRDASAS